jgi:Icc protein
MSNSAEAIPFFPFGPDEAGVVSWAHLGDLHVTTANEQNHIDFAWIVEELNQVFAGSISFCFLPGDVAADGSREAYSVVRQELDRLRVPWCAIVGEGDVREKCLHNFLHAMAERTQYAFTVGPVRFVAMNAFDTPDMPQPSSPGVSKEQIAWIRGELQAAKDAGETPVLLLHCYPSDLKRGAVEVHELMREFDVRLVDMGHTHYNEIANDGKSLYTATRSIGRVEEGAVGFSITNLDQGVISWRFVELSELPLVIITYPADERLLVDSTHSGEVSRDGLRIRAKVWTSVEILRVCARFEDNEIEMTRVGDSHVWEAVVQDVELEDGIYVLQVTVDDADGSSAEDAINMLVGDGVGSRPRAERDQDNSIGAWPEHGLLGTQLGPHKYGKAW